MGGRHARRRDEKLNLWWERFEKRRGWSFQGLLALF
jgi:hypothetical protein